MTLLSQTGSRAPQTGRDFLAIETVELIKTYGSGQNQVRAVDGVNLKVERGHIYALLGPNGAGKTTTISILTTLIPPSGGQGRVAGFDVVTQADEVRQLIGVTFQETVMDKALSGRDALIVHGRLYHMPKNEIKEQVEELVKLVELEEAIDRPVKTYSGGMKRRLELARGLMTGPEVLFLDEPTLGLDPHNRDRIWTYIQKLRAEQGLTILLTTHYMDEAEQLADRVGIIDAGRIVAEGTPQELISSMGADVVTVEGSGATERFVAALKQREFVAWANIYQPEEGEAEPTTLGGTQVQIGLNDQAGRSLRPIIELAEQSGYLVADIAIKRPSLNDVFLKLTGRRLRD
ncbi:MAG TPA: ATP-binding cassette domain-containing protein [Chloroflexia bacterium]|nr:ATP-binding cassette domain-containing protein [Chloroflexia bacterium]